MNAAPRLASALALLLLLAGGAAAASRQLAQDTPSAQRPAKTTPMKPAYTDETYERHGADWCNCPTDNKPVCGTDQQTYLNECIMGCAAAIKLKVRYKGAFLAGSTGAGGCWGA